jgi:sugar phosphate isomerase/epimerase
MKIGCCIPKSQLDSFKIRNRFDFVEAKYPDLKASTESYEELNLYALNNLIRRDINIFDQPLADTRVAIDEVFELAIRFDIQFLTFGSGGARKILGSHDLSRNISIWIEMLEYLDERALEHDIEIGIEPLAKLETNFINTIAEAAFYIEQLNLQQTGITADTFHFFNSDGSLINLEEHIDKIKHVHIASDQRKYPKNISKRNKSFLNVLKKCGYSKTIAIEIDWRENLESDPQIVYLLKEFFNE